MVKIYTRTTCAPCRAVKQWLSNKGVSYEEVNVDDNPSFIDEIIKRTGVMQVPMILVDDTAISGMNFALLSKTLMV